MADTAIGRSEEGSMIRILNCLRCGHEWPSRLPEPPAKCPRCKSELWDQPKVQRPQAQRRLIRDSHTAFNFESLEVGQSVTVPWFITPGGEIDITRNRSIGRAVTYVEHKFARRFAREPQSAGLKVTRLN